jgi:dihydrofolate reductase
MCAMGSLVVTEFITLDGVMEDPGGAEAFEHGGWAFRSDRGAEGDAFKFDELMAADVQLLGRRTYEGFAKAWPAMDGDDFGRKMNQMPKVVVSTTLTGPEWTNTTVIPDLREVAELKAHYEGDVLVAGSAQVVQSLLAEGHVDELRLMVFPVLLGKGKRLFADEGQRASFELTESRPAGECVILVFRRAGEVTSGA